MFRSFCVDLQLLVALNAINIYNRYNKDRLKQTKEICA